MVTLLTNKHIGKLILIPTPLDQVLPLESVALEMLKTGLSQTPPALFLFEEIKPARQRWLHWGLPRDHIEKFVLYNEHGQDKMAFEIIAILKSGRDVFLMSDGGLPAFCDPGQKLVHLCHEHKIIVTSSPFPNSVILGLALSGISHQSFYFAGFLPRNNPDRSNALKKMLARQETIICMDTAYRLAKLLEEIKDETHGAKGHREIFLGLDLNRQNQELFLGSIEDAVHRFGRDVKRDFILILSPSVI